MIKNEELTSQRLRKIAPELDPLRRGMGWSVEDLAKPQIIIESTFGDSHPGSAHLLQFVDNAARGVNEMGANLPDILRQISVTEWPRAMTVLIILWFPGIPSLI